MPSNIALAREGFCLGSWQYIMTSICKTRTAWMRWIQLCINWSPWAIIK